MSVHQDWDDGKSSNMMSEPRFGTTEYSCDVDMNTGAVRDFDIDHAGWDD